MFSFLLLATVPPLTLYGLLAFSEQDPLFFKRKKLFRQTLRKHRIPNVGALLDTLFTQEETAWHWNGYCHTYQPFPNDSDTRFSFRWSEQNQTHYLFLYEKNTLLLTVDLSFLTKAIQLDQRYDHSIDATLSRQKITDLMHHLQRLLHPTDVSTKSSSPFGTQKVGIFQKYWVAHESLLIQSLYNDTLWNQMAGPFFLSHTSSRNAQYASLYFNNRPVFQADSRDGKISFRWTEPTDSYFPYLSLLKNYQQALETYVTRHLKELEKNNTSIMDSSKRHSPSNSLLSKETEERIHDMLSESKWLSYKEICHIEHTKKVLINHEGTLSTNGYTLAQSHLDYYQQLIEKRRTEAKPVTREVITSSD